MDCYQNVSCLLDFFNYTCDGSLSREEFFKIKVSEKLFKVLKRKLFLVFVFD